MGTVRYRVVEDGNYQRVEEIHKVVVHRFTMSDVEDPDIYAAEPIWQWQQSDAGKFVMEHAVEQPEFHKHMDVSVYGWRFAITAKLEKKKLTEYYLKFGPIK
jgi:hypothetical protein